ncbi:MAG TPA: hypothetical protein VIY96_05510 [Thermoanaerobaculia bacterium]
MSPVFRRNLISSLLTLLFASAALPAQSADIPLRNWTVPPYSTASAGGIHTMTDVTGPRAFVAVLPCRVADTRGNGAPIQGGIFANSEARNWTIVPICGIPNGGAEAISVNFSVVSPAGTPQGAFLVAWPTGQPPANPVAIMTYGPGSTVISNAAIVPISDSGQVTVNVSHSTHVVMDVNGYFSDRLINQANNFLLANNSSAAPTMMIWNHSTSCVLDCGVAAVTDSTLAGAAIYGSASSGGNDSAGVLGIQGAGFSKPIYSGAGVRGHSRSLGVLGITSSSPTFGVGTAGSLLNVSGAVLAEGYLGYYTGTSYGVYSSGDAHVQGTFTATTNKAFVQPHPHDASKEIQYVSLEGPHSEVYFRGTAQISQGITRIAIPDHFRFVADPATYSTLVTPVGGMATVAVLSEGPDGVSVRASRNVKIHYVVYAERDAVRNPDPIVENVHFRPNPNTDFLAHLPDTFVQLMIKNGTLNPDRTVNQETVRRLGWDPVEGEPLRASARSR